MNRKIASDNAPAVRFSAEMLGDATILTEDFSGCSEPMAEVRAISCTDRMTLTNLTSDCLENIFERLPFKDLINVSESNHKLKTIACTIFERILGNTVVLIFTTPLSIYVCDELFEGTTSIQIILKNFGSAITKLCRNYDLNFNHFDTFVDDAITSYCSEALQELYINNCHSNMMANFNENFPNMRIVRFMYGQLGTEISRFDKIFPEIEEVTLNTVFCPDQIQYHFQALTVLKVYSPTLTSENISIVISLNPQLQVLKLEHNKILCLNSSMFRFIGEKLLSLEVLVLSYPINSWTDVSSNNFEQELVKIKTLKKIVLYVENADVLENVSLQLADLLELKITVLKNSSRKLVDFLSRAPRMNTLTIKIYEGNSFKIESHYLFGTFPNLRHIFLHTPDGISNKHIVRDREVFPIENKYLAKDDHTPFLLAIKVMTTKYLLQYSASPNVHIDTTYKLSTDFPITIVGVMDSDGRLVPIILAMTDDYTSIFTALKNTLMTFKPEVLVADLVEIKDAAREVFGGLSYRSESALSSFFNSMARLMRVSTGRQPVSLLHEYLERLSKKHEQNFLSK